MKSTTDRGLGYEHQQERKRQLAMLRPGEPCWRCGRPMFPGQLLDLDHTVPRVAGGAGPRLLTHRACNRAAGARMTNARRRAREGSRW